MRRRATRISTAADGLRSQEVYIRQETLSVELRIGEPPHPDAYAEERDVNGVTLLVAVARAERR